MPGKKQARFVMAFRAIIVAVITAFSAAAFAPQSAHAAITPEDGVPIKAANSGLCLNVLGGVTTDEAAIIQYACSDSQGRLRVVPQGTDTFQIVVDYDDKCLHVYDGATADYTPVNQFTCSATATNNLWRFEAVPGSTTFHIVSVQSGKCLNVQDNSLLPKATVVIFTCQGTTALNEQFSFPPAVVASLPVQLPVVRNTPLYGQQGGTDNDFGPLVYGFVNVRGQLIRGYQADPNSFQEIAWNTVSELERFTGHPAVQVQADGRVQVAARHADDGDLWMTTQYAKDSGIFGTWQDVGGSANGQPITGKLPSGKLVAFQIVEGQLWHLPQDGVNVPYAGWRYIGGTGLVGEPAVTATETGLRIFALDSAGELQTALYEYGTLGDWTSLGGSGLVGPPSVLVMTGWMSRVVMRTSEGTLVTKLQRKDYTFEPEWTALPAMDASDSPVSAAGPPALVLDPQSNRTVIVVRATDNTVHYLTETGEVSNKWNSWNQALSTSIVTDPTIVSYATASGPAWGYAVLDAVSLPSLVTFGGPLPASNPAGKLAGSDKAKFTEHRLPKPPTD